MAINLPNGMMTFQVYTSFSYKTWHLRIPGTSPYPLLTFAFGVPLAFGDALAELLAAGLLAAALGAAWLFKGKGWGGADGRCWG